MDNYQVFTFYNFLNMMVSVVMGIAGLFILYSADMAKFADKGGAQDTLVFNFGLMVWLKAYVLVLVGFICFVICCIICIIVATGQRNLIT